MFYGISRPFEASKSPDFFQDNNAILRRIFFLSLRQPQGSTRENFNQIFHTLVSVKRVFIIKTLYLTSTPF